ncbi:hypothetical protein [Synoicihabitans lomoniglobus]|uniref:Uncharacterized protein n=1 Tax=Synoicihabitans lomoniglobus TaxID=2909285 RepID=A0AAF0I431_9BACT|nr:hypothetical protein [Opitutaceae bacterium LMO-M01]WED67392.1 hypothetical protein PXH66_11080 [Opitutaceae bacterium LMO-M01]
MSSTVHRSIWWFAVGGALLALAAHLDLIRVFGTVLPYRDQWQLTGVELLGPWLDGKLSLHSFFQPLNDHWPVLTRVLSFTLIRLNGQWNNLVSITVNALILTAAILLFLRALLPGISGVSRLVFALLTGVIMALPIAWQNTLWGIQSLPYLQILLSLAYLHLLCTATRIDSRWTLAQVIGILVLFTQHSSILAHVSILPICVWKLWRKDGDARLHLFSSGAALATLCAFFLFFPAIKETAQFRADSVALAVEVTLRQLAFPTGHPGWAFLIWAPWLVYTIDALGRGRLTAPSAFVIAAGLWVGGQAAAIGYGRGAETYTFASRYCDFLALGFIINGAAWLMLIQTGIPHRLKVGWVALGLAWMVVPLKGFWWEATESHAGFNLANRFVENPANVQRVHDYIATRDPAVLSLERGGNLLFTYPPSVQMLLDRPHFRALLPPETGAPEARSDHGRLGGLARSIYQNPLIIALLGFGCLGGGLLSGRSETIAKTMMQDNPSRWTPASLLQLVGAAGLIAAGFWSQWYLPMEFNAMKRAHAVIEPDDAELMFAELSFRRESAGNIDPLLAAGATLSEPDIWRPFTYGTAINGPGGFQGIFASAPIPITDDYLSVLFTGFPCAHGNGLRWKLIPPANGDPAWIGYDGPNPESGWSTWTIDVRSFRNWTASLTFFDGRTDREGWLGTTRPVLTSDPNWADTWRARLRAERAGPAHRVVAVATLTLLSTWLLGGSVLLFKRSRPAA